MTRKKSITDLANLYESMYSGENVLEEKASGKKFPKNSFPKAGEEVKEPKTLKKSGPGNVKGFKKFKKNKKKSGKVHKENINSSMKSKFDKLFENVMDDELDVNLDLGPGAGPEDASAEDMNMDLGAESESGSEDITLTLDRETAQKLHDMLGDVLGGGEELSGEEDSDLEDLEIDTDSEESSNSSMEDEDEEEMEDEDEEEDDESYKEAIESEKLPDSKGHSLTKAGTVGSIKASKGKASSDVTDEVGSSHLGDKSNVLQKPGTVGNLSKGQDFFKS